MTFYCTNCWAVVVESATKCPQCGADIETKQAGSDYADKLIAALGHPEPTTPIRAAWILGERREFKALELLIKLFKQSQDPFIVEAAVAASGKMDDERARATLVSATTHSSPRVRLKAVEALKRPQTDR